MPLKYSLTQFSYNTTKLTGNGRSYSEQGYIKYLDTSAQKNYIPMEGHKSIGDFSAIATVCYLH